MFGDHQERLYARYRRKENVGDGIEEPGYRNAEEEVAQTTEAESEQKKKKKKVKDTSASSIVRPKRQLTREIKIPSTGNVGRVFSFCIIPYLIYLFYTTFICVQF
jgi:hypothetical protein